MKYLVIFISILFAITGCAPQNTRATPKIDQTTNISTNEKNTTKETISKKIPQKPKKIIELKKVEDNNFSSEYMYPENKVKEEKIITVAQDTPAPPEAPGPIITKEECINMIGQEKFDKYTALLGSEEASIKRCEMIKKVQQ
ncbi:MAG: hypothetical protein QG564_1738 [Campylobacterota bacterium]|nr:hypothetical protein [Campylobacterota bacterium]